MPVDRDGSRKVFAVDGRPGEVADWLRQLRPEQRKQAEWLAGLVHAAGGGFVEAIKWRRLTLTVCGDWHHWVCAIAVTTREVSLTFHKGSLLHDPAGVLRGTGRYLRHVRYDQAIADPEAITALVRGAIVRQTDMLDDEA